MMLALLLLALQAGCGALAWQALRRGRAPWLEAIGMGTALGTAVSGLSGVVLWGRMPLWLGTLGPLLAIGVVSAVLLRSRLQGSTRSTNGARIGAGVGLLSGAAALLANLGAYPLTWTGTVTTYHPDMLFFEALSRSLATYGPNDSIFMAGADLRYHWLSYAWSGQLAEISGADPFVVLTRVLPVACLVSVTLLAASWTSRLTRVAWAPAIAALLIVMGGYVGATYGTILNIDSPSQAMSSAWLLALAFATWQSLRRHVSQRLFLALLFVLFVLGAAATLGKASSGLVGVGAWGFAALLGTVLRTPWWRRAWLAFAAMALGAAWVTLDFIAGSAEGGGVGLGGLLDKASSVQGLNPTTSPRGIVLGTLILVLAMAPRWAGLVWLLRSPRSRHSVLTLFSTGLVVVAVLTVLLVSGGLNDTWFALAASAPLAVASSVGLARGVQSVTGRTGWWPGRSVVLAAAGGVLLSVVVLLLWLRGPDSTPALRWTAPIVALAGAVLIGAVLRATGRPDAPVTRTWLVLTLVVLTTLACEGRLLGIASDRFAVQAATGFNRIEFSMTGPLVPSLDDQWPREFSAAQAEAGAWLEEHAGVHELVATNLTYGPLVPALSGRQTYLTALRYQAPYGRRSLLDEVIRREEASWAFIDAPSAATVGPLCSDGVQWIWVDPTRTDTRAWVPYASVAHETADATILRLDRSAC